MTSKRKHIIFALVALLCQNNICCVESRCKRVEDINPPTCNIEDLSDYVLLGICERIPGLKKNKKNHPNREAIVRAAKVCLAFEQDLNSIANNEFREKAQRAVSMNMDEVIYGGNDLHSRRAAVQK